MSKVLPVVLLSAWLAMSVVGCSETIPPKETEAVKTEAETSVPSETILETLRKNLGEDAFCAVSYLGYEDGSYYDVMAHIDSLGVWEDFPFAEVPKENFVSSEGGELYMVIPADRNAVVKVYSAVMDETDYTVKPHTLLAEFTDGDPILLKCNVSEIMPNVVLEITSDGTTYTYIPCLSGRDGHLVSAEGVVDFSSYEDETT